MKRTLVNWFGLFGLISLISYALGVIFAPSAYPGYDWLSQPSTDLYAVDAPSFALWNQLASLYAIGALVCAVVLAIAVQGKWNKPLRSGIYLISGTLWLSSVGSSLLRFSATGDAITFPAFVDGILSIVVLLSLITSMILIMVGGYREKRFTSIANCATVALIFSVIGLVSGVILPADYAGVASRIANFSVNGFVALLGLYLFMGKLDNDRSITI